MKTYGLIGKTLSHSFSSEFFKNYFQKEAIEASYQNFELESIEGILSVFAQNPSGLNVTIPYKELVIPYLDALDPIAEAIGAVNTIVFKDGQKIGYNSDAFGFQQSIKPFLCNHHERALIFGTGGASKAIAYVLKNIGIDVLYVSRNPNGESKHFSYKEVNENMIHACKLIINCTPVGSYPNTDEILPIPFSAFGADHFVIDLIYNPKKTKLLHEAEQQGATIMNGKSMLQEQALKSWEYWNQ